ncbi:MAG: hypothetical protein Q9M24_01555 [Mariprofundaceae bacterium]|nr:hypothetical protein [Mariprofundaceae bacterium]
MNINLDRGNIFLETPWEDRNLGLKTFTINDGCLGLLSQGVLEDELSRLRCDFNKFFIFSRLPKVHLHLVPVLQNCGFYLVEGIVCPVLRFDKSPLLETFRMRSAQFIPVRFKEHAVHFISLDDEREKYAERLLSIARESFSDDRFHIDFRCSEDVANRRFESWVNDLLDDRQVMFDMLEVNREAAGFMARKGNSLILAGFSRKYVRSGLGDYLWLGALQRMHEQGLRYAESLVSMNNIPVLNLYARLGFKFRNPQYSFHYWSQ